MAHSQDYRSEQFRDGQRGRLNYYEMEHSSISSRYILIILGLMLAAIVALAVYGDMTTAGLEEGAPVVAPETITPSAPSTLPAPSTPVE